MQVELHINGRLNVELVPETNIEGAVLQEMETAASKGKPVKLEPRTVDGVHSFVVSVEK